MNLRFLVLILISSSIRSTIDCRHVGADIPNRLAVSSEEDQNGECDDQRGGSGEIDTTNVPNTGFQTTINALQIVDGDNGDNDDNQLSIMATTRMPFRKRRGVINSLVESSASREIEGSGENDLTTKEDWTGQKTVLVDPAEKVFNTSNINGPVSGTVNATQFFLSDVSKSNETGESDENATITDADLVSSNAVQSEYVNILKGKIRCWQKAVDNYLHEGRRRRRKRQQSTWSQLFPASASSSSNTYNNNQPNKESFANVASNAVGDALKPAMELMNQGVDLLSDLYSAQMTRTVAEDSSTAFASISTNQTVATDQFRGQLKTLQRKLGDLGEQLRRVVGTFQQMQLPFLDQLLSGGIVPLKASPQTGSDFGNVNNNNAVYGKVAKNKN